MSHLLYQVAGRLYASNLDELEEVLMPLRLHPVAGSPDFLKGAINLRHTMIPVISLAAQLGDNNELSYRKRSRILTTLIDERAVGFVVEATFRIIDFSAADQLNNVLKTMSHQAFTGSVWNYEDNNVYEISLQKILSDAQLSLLTEKSFRQTISKMESAS